MAPLPKVFISYASEDPHHTQWVKELGARLRVDGFDVVLERWGARPGDELSPFIGHGQRDASFLLLVCTPEYKAKVDGRLQRVDYEASHAASAIQTGMAHRSVIPLQRAGTWREAAPSVVFGDYYVDLSAVPMRENAYRDLVDTMQAQLWVVPVAPPSPKLLEGPGGASVRPVANFVARDTELAAMVHDLTEADDTTTVAVMGAAGVGKTALCRQFVATYGASLFPDGVIWLDGRKLASELSRAARRCGYNAEIDPTSEQAVAFLGKELPSSPLLLIIDDLADGAVVAELTAIGGKCRFLVTSRHEQPDLRAVTIRLERLSRATVRTYLRQLVARLEREPDADLDALGGFVQGLPLGIAIMAGVFGSQPKRSAKEYLARLKAEPVGALRAFAKEGDRGMVGVFLETYRGLAPNERRMLSALAACSQGTTLETAAGVAGLENSSGAPELSRLSALGLADYCEGAEGPWGLHDVVRAFARAQPGAQDAEAAHLAWVRDRLRPNAGQAPAEVSNRVIEEAVTALERQLEAGDGAWVGPLFQLLYKHLTAKGRYPTVVDLGARLLALEGCLPTLEVQAGLLGNLGIWQGRLGNMPKAIEYLERSLAINEGLGRLDAQAIQLGNLGNCYLTLGDVTNAIEYLLLSLAINEQLGREEDQALLLGNLGLAYRKLGSVPQAIGFHHRALAMHERLDRLDGQAAQLGQLGFCYREQGDYRRAVELHESALALYEMLDRFDGQAAQLGHILSCCEALHDRQLAIRFLERSLGNFRTAGLSEQHPTMLKFRRMLSAARG